MKRILSTILLLSMLTAVFTACGDTSDENSDTSDTASSVETDPADLGPQLELPEDLDYSEDSNNKIVVLTAEGLVHGDNQRGG